MRLLIRVFFVIFFIILPAKVYAQYNKIAGVVVDSITSEPIPFATISIKGDNKSIMTNDNGEFETTINENKNITITTSSVGYHRSSNKFNISDSNFVTIKLIPSGVVLNEITVKKQKHKYSKKNNPAVIFANKIRSAKNIGDPYNHEFYNYNKYKVKFRRGDWYNHTFGEMVINNVSYKPDKDYGRVFQSIIEQIVES